MTPGKLYLIPNIIAENTQDSVIPLQVKDTLQRLRNFLVEDVRTARRYLSSLKIYASIEPLQFQVLNKDTAHEELPGLMAPLLNGLDIGVISESGCPGVADPGAMAVHYAHNHGIAVIPLTGPSSILMALMASGLNGQKFAFQGYLPVDSQTALKTIKEYERESKQKGQTQIFIETPYRNNAVFGFLLNGLHSSTQLTVALDITGPHQQIQTKTIADWKTSAVHWPKSPAVFLFLA